MPRHTAGSTQRPLTSAEIEQIHEDMNTLWWKLNALQERSESGSIEYHLIETAQKASETLGEVMWTLRVARGEIRIAAHQSVIERDNGTVRCECGHEARDWSGHTAHIARVR